MRGGAFGVQRTEQLDTMPRPYQWQTAAKTGLILYECFGGLCAGLESVLRNGIHIHKYLYSDISAPAQQDAKHRVEFLHQQYPNLFPLSAT